MTPQHRFTGAIAGLVAAAVALGVGELAAAVTRPAAAPLDVVGDAAIDVVPTSVRNVAISTFGTSDKTVLITGITVVLALCAALVGAFSTRRPAVGVTAAGVLGAVGLAAALTRPDVRPLDGLPSVLAALAGAASLYLLLWRHRADTELVRPDPAGSRPQGTSSQNRVAATAADARHEERRRFLVTGGALAATAAVTGLGGRAAADARFDVTGVRAALRVPTPDDVTPPVPASAQLRTPGASRFYTPNSSFYRVDTALVVPQLQPKTWSLRIHGMVDHPVTLSYDQLVARDLIERDVTLTCVSNDVGGPYVGNARWIGARLADLLDEVGLQPGADQLVSRSADGLTIGTPTAVVMDGRDAMLAVAMNNEPLPVVHGFPVRMVVPGLYGYVSACKWIVDIEATTFDAFDAYWVEEGWAQRGPVLTQSRIDTPREGASLPPGTVVVAGVAWAQHRGIERVEVQADDEPWRSAGLFAVPSADTWRQWVFRWQVAAPGRHRLRVRATDGTGKTQPQQRTSPFPSGATGWHTVTVTVR